MQVKSCLHIDAACKHNNTYLQNCYHTHPYKIANITEDKTNSELRLMMMSSSPGILSNDEYDVIINLQEGAALHLTTQAYQRLFTMEESATQRVLVQLAEQSSLCYLPHPVVPHKGASFTSVNNIYLQPQHRLLWSEIITCGRKHCGEEFTFKRYQNVTNIFINNKLVVKENVLLQPSVHPLNSIGQLEGYTHQSTLLWLDDKAAIPSLIEDCRTLLSTIEGVAYGVSQLPVNGLIIRLLGFKGEQLMDAHMRLAALLRSTVRENSAVSLPV
jgi:urease accessory protein